MTEPRRRYFFLLGSIGLATLIALAPWWRNRGYLRDLYDYGLVLAANGHLDRGEHAYVDFTTPIQAGFLGLNWMIEKAGGGTYAGLTRGGAGLILATCALAILILARRWPLWAAAVVGGAVAVSGASQHTILWHNSLGVFCLLLVAWPAACAPVWRRTTWPWHLLAALGLILGGLNKLNFHLVAIAAALGWAIRAGLTGRAEWRRVALTALAVVVLGLALPLAVECAWTGATFSQWTANVITRAAGARTAELRQIFSTHFLVRPIHDYYGRLPLPQVGLAGIFLSLATLLGCWPREKTDPVARWDRWLVPVSVLCVMSAGAALLATNYEIACLGLAAWLVLLVSVWLGFPAVASRRFLAGGLVLPALVLGCAAWWAAWLGLRSQFGYSPAPRAEYRPAEEAGPAFTSLTGLRIPPEVMQSLEVVEQLLPPVNEDGLRPVFYGPGLEYVSRHFPGVWEKGQPLWAHWGTSYGPAEIMRLGERFEQDGHYRMVVATLAFDSWPETVRNALQQHYVKDLMGPVFRRWTWRDRDAINWADSFETIDRLGGNVDGQLLLLDRFPLQTKQVADAPLVFGTAHREGNVLLRPKAYRVRGRAVLVRLPGQGDGPIYADFKAIIHGASPEDVRWWHRLELPAGQPWISVPFEADAGGLSLLLWVSQPESNHGAGFAGFRELEITHAIESAGEPPRLRPGGVPEVAGTPEMAASLFGGIAWRPQRMTVRGAQAGAQGLELAAGGETWIHTDNMTGQLRGRIALPAGNGRPTSVRVVWYKGGRLQFLQRAWVKPDEPFEFHAWTAEPGGWIGILADATADAGPVTVRVTESGLTP